MAARRAAECRQWARGGHRSAEEWLAQVSGTTQRAAQPASPSPSRWKRNRRWLAHASPASFLRRRPARSPPPPKSIPTRPGGWSMTPAEPASKLSPGRSCRQVVRAGRSAQDDQARLAAIHRSRYLRQWTDRDGAGRIDARMTPEALARFQACLRPFQTNQFEEAWQAGSRESPEAYAVDALLALAEAAHTKRTCTESDVPPRPAGTARKVGPPATVIALVDHAALVRGFVKGDECCFIKGIGPVPVTTIRTMLSDAFLAVCRRRRGRHPICGPHRPQAFSGAIDCAVRPRPHLRGTGLPLRGPSRSAPRHGLVEHENDHPRRSGSPLFASS